MRVGIIGRTEILYQIALKVNEAGFQLAFILTSKEAPEYKTTAEDFRLLAQKLNVHFAQSSRISDLTEFLEENLADIALSMNYTGILSKEIIDLFPYGVLNAHGGDLPRYRGNACQAWAILNGEHRIAMCIHKMIGGELDSGDIIAREYFEIDSQTKITQVWEWMFLVTPSLMMNALSNLAIDSKYVLEVQSKSASDALRCYPRRPDDGRIEWREAAINVLRLVNASNRPYAGAFCYYEDKKLVIWDAVLNNDGEVFCAVPGQVMAIGSGFVDVACGSGKLRILKIQLEDDIECSPDQHISSIRKRLS